MRRRRRSSTRRPHVVGRRQSHSSLLPSWPLDASSKCGLRTKAGPSARDSFVEFVSIWSTGLLRCAWLLTGDAGRAEDLLQTALTTAWQHWYSIERADNPEAYVRRVIFTTYVAWWRRRWRSELPSGELPEVARKRGYTTPPDPGSLGAGRTPGRMAQRATRTIFRVVRPVLFHDMRLVDRRTATRVACSAGLGDGGRPWEAACSVLS